MLIIAFIFCVLQNETDSIDFLAKSYSSDVDYHTRLVIDQTHQGSKNQGSKICSSLLSKWIKNNHTD